MPFVWASKPRLHLSAVLTIAAIVGAWLRLDQVASQVLIEDEWHPVHQVIYYTPKHVLLTFGNADYSIPLVFLYFLEAGTVGLSELNLRFPMLLAGVASVALVPLMFRRRFEEHTLAVFALLLAVSPFLVSYSRIARPYALTLLGIYFAHWLFERAFRRERVDWNAASGYAVVCGLVVWTHAVTGPMLVAPLVATWWGWLQRRDGRWRQLLGLTGMTGLFMAIAVIPPVLGDPEAIAGKAGIDSISVATVIGAWHLYIGTGSTLVACAAALFAALGFMEAWKSSPIVRWIGLGAALTVATLLIVRPWWVDRPLVFGRYLLPVLPAVLLTISAGLVKAWTLVVRRLARIESLGAAWGGVALVLLMLGWSKSTPYGEILRRPNSYTQHSYFQLDYRKPMNAVRPRLSAYPMSQFWATLSPAPEGTLTVAVAPFYYATYEWAAPLWERASGQRVIPAYLWGACEASRHGEVPPDARFRFRNAIHVADDWEWRANRVDYIAYSKVPPTAMDPPSAGCMAWMRRRFGIPIYEDFALIVWKTPAGADHRM